ncbi:MAG TPA: 23S rRNA pseudouridine(1911/1915/1917) synthase RluD [Burkholderiales bacterium]|nr:23S rRNA pseudouridine(1911/1915/1917) synthase RluD [Burkholderiales bacterium]
MMDPKNIPADYSATDEDDAGVITLDIPADCVGMRLDQALARLLPEYSRSRLQSWIRDSLVVVDDAPATVSQKLRGVEKISVAVQPDADELAFTPEAIPLNIVFEDDALIVLNKPPGLVVHPGNGNWSGTLLNGLLHHCASLTGVPRAGIVHRLDKDTSGLMAIAKTLIAQTHLVRQLQARSVSREYLAIVDGAVTRDGSVDAPIGRHPRERTRMAVVSQGKEAVTHYQALERLPHHTLVACRLETGRTHQIRVHMQSLGFPLASDPVYGGRPRALPEPVRQALEVFGRQALHARRLALRHPTTEELMSWEAPLPADMQTLLDTLRVGG